MPLTKEQLMRPRYKVIADFPESNFPINSICDCNDQSVADYFAKYPAIFKPIQWWEERAESDMPEYVKVTGHGFIVLGESEGKVFKVIKFSGKGGALDHLRVEPHGGCTCSWFLPSDESEYQSFNQNKVK